MYVVDETGGSGEGEGLEDLEVVVRAEEVVGANDGGEVVDVLGAGGAGVGGGGF